MTITTQINPHNNPNLAGEVLRDWFFDQSEGRGCYYSFYLNDDVEELEEIPVPEWDFDENDQPILREDMEFCEYKFTHARKNDVVMLCYYEGDGFLSFILPDGSYLYNPDCKKDYGWKIAKSFDDYWKSAYC